MGLKALFPTPFSVGIFVGYMALFINQGMLITGSKNAKNKYEYNTTTVVLLTESLKFCIAVGIFVRSHSLKKYFAEAKKHRKMLLFYMVPAFLYCLYNNLTFINLSNYDPTSYFLLLQLRVVVTGVVFQILFQKKLSKLQWISLLILTAGCVLKEWGNSHKTVVAVTPSGSSSSSPSTLLSPAGPMTTALPFLTDVSSASQLQLRKDMNQLVKEEGESLQRTKRVDDRLFDTGINQNGNENRVVAVAADINEAKKTEGYWYTSIKDSILSSTSLQGWLGSFDPSSSSRINAYFFLILIQVFCSCFAGVYNEYLLKSKGSDMDIQLQNSFMYINSIICNVVVLSFTGQLGDAISSHNIGAILSFRVFPIIINNALIGIVTSLFLKTLDSIVKVFASALELLFTAILSWAIFGFPIDIYTVFAIALVSFAIYVYSKNPVQNPAASTLPVAAPKTS